MVCGRVESAQVTWACEPCRILLTFVSRIMCICAKRKRNFWMKTFWRRISSEISSGVGFYRKEVKHSKEYVNEPSQCSKFSRPRSGRKKAGRNTRQPAPIPHSLLSCFCRLRGKADKAVVVYKYFGINYRTLGYLFTSCWLTAVSIYVMLRSSKGFDTCKTGSPKWLWIL